jgi:tetratricopeptide (TPR) repeat protein
MSESMKRYLVIFVYSALICSTLLVFWQVRNFDFVDYDDSIYVNENPNVTKGLSSGSILWAFATSYFGYWQPLTWLSLMLDCQLFGVNPGWIHLVNLFLHLANTLLLFAVFRKMTGSLWPSAFVAAAFALHPMHVESVVWISERKDVLSTLFMMLTLAAYAGFVRHRGLVRYLLTILLFILGLLAKPMLVTLPFLLLMLDYWPLGRFSAPQAVESAADRQRRVYRILIEKIPFFALAAASSVITFLTQQTVSTIVDFKTIPCKDRVGNALLSYAAYMGKIFWPRDLAIFYPFDAGHFTLGQAAMCVLLLLGISVFVIRFGRERKYLPVGWFWFVGTLIPVIGLVQFTGSSYADRFTYIPYIGLFIIIAWGLPDLFSKWPGRKLILGISGVIALTALGIVARQQTSYWNNSFTLFSHVLEVTQNNYVAYNGRGIAYFKLGRYQEAIEDLNKALRIRPDFDAAYNNRGIVYVDLGRYQEAIEDLGQVIRIRPDYAEAYNNLGAVYGQLGRWQEAVKVCVQAVKIKPDYAEAHSNLGFAYSQLGRWQEAIEAYRQAIKMDPDLALTYNHLGTALAKLDRWPEAVESYQQAIRIQPDYAEAYNNLGIVMKAQGDYVRAMENFARVIELEPNAVEPRNDLALLIIKRPELKGYNIEQAIGLARHACQLTQDHNAAYLDTLALAYLSAGRVSEAAKTAQAALSRDPNLASAHRVLGKALSSEGDFKKAVVHIKRSLEIEPSHLGAKNNLAWILATSPDPDTRNPSQAMGLAQEVCDARNSLDPSALDTLAAAYASGGRFTEAVAAAQKALGLAADANQVELKNTIERHILLYKQNKPYIESAGKIHDDVNTP